MANFFLTHKAVEDLSEIWFYTFEVWSERQADKYFELLTDSFQDIANNEVSGKNYLEISNDVFGFRVGKHIVFYRIIKSGETEILRILHQGMDIKNRIDK